MSKPGVSLVRRTAVRYYTFSFGSAENGHYHRNDSVSTCRFSIEGKWYEAPSDWIARRIKEFRDVGMTPSRAAVEAMRLWALFNKPDRS